VVEGGSHVVDTIPNHQRQLRGRLFDDLRPQDMLAGLRVELQGSATSFSFEPPLDGLVQAVSMNRPSIEFQQISG
jgi:hypothetical protein